MKKLKYAIEKGKGENPKKLCLDCLLSPLSGLWVLSFGRHLLD